MENLTRKTQNPVQEGGAAAKEGSSQPWLFQELLETRVSTRKSFQDKKPGRSSGFGRGFGSFQGQSHEPSAFFCSTSSPQPSLGVAFRVGTAEQRAEQAQPHPGASQLQVTRAHTSKEGASWQPGSTQHTWQGSECPAGPRDPSLCLFPTRQGHFWLGQSLGLMEKSGSCVPVTSCFLLLDLRGSLELPTGFSRNGTPPAWNCNPQHSHTQRNSRSVIEFTFDGGNEPVTHTGSSSFIPSLPTLHLPAPQTFPPWTVPAAPPPLSCPDQSPFPSPR